MDAPAVQIESGSLKNSVEAIEPEIKSSQAAPASGTLPNEGNSANDRENGEGHGEEQGDPAAEGKPLSKNQQRKLKRQQRWEDGKEDRKRRRKEKRQDQKARKREQREDRVAEAVAAGIDPSSLFKKPPKVAAVNVPIALIIDCDFEQYMRDSEIVSLGSQITRCYSDNRLGPYRTHLYVSSWQGKLRNRFRDVLEDVQKNWKGIQFIEDDFEAAAAQAMERFGSGQGGTVIDRIKPNETPEPKVEEANGQLPEAIVEVAPADAKPHIIYLSSESEHTLERLEANTCYVIGGLVDRNREKGLCHKRATERGLRTARLPIGQYMMLQSRQVLATNHVVEIMLRWLECGDWGEAFLKVIPKRKGVQLRKPVDPASGSPPDSTGRAGALGEEEDAQPYGEDATEEEEEAPEVDEDAKEVNLRQDLTEASTKF